MFRKIHSNRDPRDTLFSEIKKEFGKYFDNIGSRLDGWTLRYPRFLFGTMVICILLSLALSFTVFRHRAPAAKPPWQRAAIKKPPPGSLAPISDGFSKIIALGTALHETIALKKTVDSLMAKKELSKQDSITLEKALDRLQQISKPFNPSKNGH